MPNTEKHDKTKPDEKRAYGEKRRIIAMAEKRDVIGEYRSFVSDEIIIIVIIIAERQTEGVNAAVDANRSMSGTESISDIFRFILNCDRRNIIAEKRIDMCIPDTAAM